MVVGINVPLFSNFELLPYFATSARKFLNAVINIYVMTQVLIV